MHIGDLNRRITLQYSTRVSDGLGGWVVTWVDHATIFAAIWPVSVKEIVAANTTNMVISHRIRIRYRSVLKPSWRIRYANRYFSIVGITNPSESNEWLDILCKEVA